MQEALSWIQTEESCDRHHSQHMLLCLCVIFKNSSRTGGTNRDDFDDLKGAMEQITHHFTRTEFIAFLKQCARKHKLQETFTAAHASREGIQRLTLGQLKPQLGLIKLERTVPQVPAGTWQMEEVYGSNTPNSSTRYFYNLPSTSSWFKADATYKLQQEDLDMGFRCPGSITSHFLSAQLSRCDIVYFQWRYCLL